MKPAHANTGAPEPLGNLSIFPREVRDEVYRHVFPTGNIAFYLPLYEAPAFYVKLDRSLGYLTFESWTKVKLSLLCLSMTFRDEAMSYLYSKGIFCFNYSFLRDQDPNVDINIINRVSKVEILYDVMLDKDSDIAGFDVNMVLLDDSTPARAGALSFLQGASIARKSVSIGLRVDYPLCQGREMPISAKMTKSPLLEALKQFTGFETVTLTLLYDEMIVRPEAHAGDCCMSFEPFFSVIRKTLEPTLGNSSAISGTTRIGRYKTMSERRHITSHPRDHLAALANANNDAVDVEQPMSID